MLSLMPKAHTDPSQLPVQLNAQVPFEYREFLRRKAHDERVSMNWLVRNALYTVYPIRREVTGASESDAEESESPA